MLRFGHNAVSASSTVVYCSINDNLPVFMISPFCSACYGYRRHRYPGCTCWSDVHHHWRWLAGLWSSYSGALWALPLSWLLLAARFRAFFDCVLSSASNGYTPGRQSLPCSGLAAISTPPTSRATRELAVSPRTSHLYLTSSSFWRHPIPASYLS